MGWGALNDRPAQPSFFGNQDNQHRDDAAADGKDPPHEPLPMRRDLWRVDGDRGWHVVFAPHGDGPIVKVVHFTPATKDQERLVVRIAYKYPLQAVTICVMEYCA